MSLSFSHFIRIISFAFFFLVVQAVRRPFSNYLQKNLIHSSHCSITMQLIPGSSHLKNVEFPYKAIILLFSNYKLELFG